MQGGVKRRGCEDGRGEGGLPTELLKEGLVVEGLRWYL